MASAVFQVERILDAEIRTGGRSRTNSSIATIAKRAGPWWVSPSSDPLRFLRPSFQNCTTSSSGRALGMTTTRGSRTRTSFVMNCKLPPSSGPARWKDRGLTGLRRVPHHTFSPQDRRVRPELLAERGHDIKKDRFGTREDESAQRGTQVRIRATSTFPSNFPSAAAYASTLSLRFVRPLVTVAQLPQRPTACA